MLRRIQLWVWLLLGVALLLAAWFSFRAGPPPAIAIESALPGIGKRTEIRVRVEEPSRGVGDVRAELVQDDRVTALGEQSYEPLAPWKPWGNRTESAELVLEAGSESVPGLREGEATIRVTASRAPGWLRRPRPVIVERTLPVKLRPPTLSVTSTRTYVSQGGAEAVVYRVGGTAVEDGVRVGKRYFPGYPLPGGGEGERFALFGVPFDFEDERAIRLVARDDVGNEATAGFVDRFKRVPYGEDTIRVNDPFLEKVVPEILAQTPGLEDRGSPLENYLQINRDLRAKNAETLDELATRTAPEFLWSRRFVQAPGSKVTSRFADRRTYVYEGRDVDRQDHLGFDLASTRRAEIPASNSGIVLLAKYFGIYGNAVVIDHGYGLMTLYGHLSSLAVEEGQRVERGQTIGQSGETGLAGGDHLHFTVLLRGLPVNPEEWWDAHWIEDRLALKLGDAFDFAAD